MSYRKWLDKQAIFVYILIAGLICCASTAVPMVNGSFIDDIVDTKNNLSPFIYSSHQSSDAPGRYYNKHNNRERSIFSLITQFHASENKKKMDFFNAFYTKIMPLLLEISLFINGKKSFYQLSDNLKHLIDEFKIFQQQENWISDNFNEKQSVPLNDPDDDFDEYWKKYVTAVNHWQSPPIEKDNFEEWLAEAKDYNVEIVADAMDTIRLIVAVALVSRTAALIVLAYFMRDIIDYLVYIIVGVTLFLDLTSREVDIALHIIDSETKEGINGLEGSIVAYSVNVIETKDPSYHNDFTYLLGFAVDTPESGWYTLSRRPGKNYLLAPSPPGTWNITIDDGDGPYKKTEVEEFKIGSGNIYIMDTIELEKD